jgi:6-phosphofructokinase 1
LATDYTDYTDCLNLNRDLDFFQPATLDQSMTTASDLIIPTLGPCRFPAPGMARDLATEAGGWVTDDQKILFDDSAKGLAAAGDLAQLPLMEMAGPRREIFFDPGKTTCAIVTCGGLCPGLNDVIRSIVMQAHDVYGIRRVLGLRYGYESLNPACGHQPMDLTPASVAEIHRFGGTILGSSRGGQDVGVMVDSLARMEIDILFVVGGDGSQQGALAIHREIARRGLSIAVVGVPKTIDNDLLHIDRSFGFLTAFSVACEAVKAAQCEAAGARNGLGLVKLMGRDSGFIACGAALATSAADLVLIPEVPFALDGGDGLFAEVKRRLAAKGHAIIIAAEGAGQDLCAATTLTDRSGNKLKSDIGLFLKEVLRTHFKGAGIELNIKYIDPSYMIRGVPATAADSVFCLHLGAAAVHAAMTGRTGMVVATRHNRHIHLPMPLVTTGRRMVDPGGPLWRSVLETTGQPAVLGD